MYQKENFAHEYLLSIIIGEEVYHPVLRLQHQMVFDAIALLNRSKLDFEVMTVFIPGIIDTDEIEKIAEFLAGIETKIRYKIIRYVPIGNISRRPTEAEINDAVSIAKEYLSNVTSSLEERTHPLKSVRVRI